MPDDRAVATTETHGRLLAGTQPGDAAWAETSVALYTDGHGGADEIAEPRKLGVVFWICIGWVAVVLFGAVFANLLPLQSPTFQNYTAINAHPSMAHLLGTDDLGRDLLSRIIYGSRVSLIVGFASVAIGMLVGGTLGLVSGYRGGRIDNILNAGSFVLLAFPAIVAVIAIVAFWGQSLGKITVILGVATIPLLYRVVRATTLSYANRDFVVAARTLGAKDSRILFREILPNVVPAAVSFGLITVAIVIVLEGSLAFRGLSVALPTASWGNIISEGTANGNLSSNPYIVLWPSLAMFLLLLAINLIGDRLRNKFDVREGLV
ncbi:MAG: ABC transporter permease [Acidimicrobiales bacterium]